MRERDRERQRETERKGGREREGGRETETETERGRDEGYYIRKTYTHAEQEIISQICLDIAEF